VHETKTEVCEICTNDPKAYAYNPKQATDHKGCAEFPTHPFLRVIKEGLCGFSFEPASDEDRAKHKKLIAAWDIK
jgi:hypothetical protein